MQPPPTSDLPLAYSAPKKGTERFVGGFMLGVGWDIALPIASVADFTSNVSAKGFDVLFQYWLHKNFTIGGAVGWQTYSDERPRETYQLDTSGDAALTATFHNSVQNGAARLVGRGYLFDDGPVLPFGGLSIGVGWTTFQSSAADIALYDNTTSILLGAELGALFVPSSNGPMFTASARYTVLPAASFGKVDDVQSVTFQLGVMMP
jgi:hypothetical protein